MYVAAIILWMDPSLSSFMNSLERQAANQKLGSLMTAERTKPLFQLKQLRLMPQFRRWPIERRVDRPRPKLVLG